MENELNQDEVKEALTEATDKMKSGSDMFKAERKAALTWNIIFFVGILSSTIAVSIVSKVESFDFVINYIKNESGGLEIGTAIFGLISSFLAGVLGSYYKSRSLKKETTYDIAIFLKEAYLNRLDKSTLNPNRKFK